MGLASNALVDFKSDVTNSLLLPCTGAGRSRYAPQKLALVAPQTFETIGGHGTQDLTLVQRDCPLPSTPLGDMEAPLLYRPAVRDAAYAYAKVKTVAVRVGPAALGTLCEPLHRWGQSG